MACLRLQCQAFVTGTGAGTTTEIAMTGVAEALVAMLHLPANGSASSVVARHPLVPRLRHLSVAGAPPPGHLLHCLVLVDASALVPRLRQRVTVVLAQRSPRHVSHAAHLGRQRVALGEMKGRGESLTAEIFVTCQDRPHLTSVRLGVGRRQDRLRDRGLLCARVVVVKADVLDLHLLRPAVNVALAAEGLPPQIPQCL